MRKRWHVSVTTLKALTNSLFAWSLIDNADPQAEKGLPTIGVAVGILLSWTVALIASLKDSNPIIEIRLGDYEIRRLAPADDPDDAHAVQNSAFRKVGFRSILTIYIVGSLFPLWLLRHVIAASQEFSRGIRHLFDVSGVSLGRVFLPLGIALVGSASLFAVERTLPLQTVRIQATTIAPYQFKNDKSDGIAVNVSFVVVSTPANANVVFFSESLDDFMFADWSVTDISLSSKIARVNGRKKPFVSFDQDTISSQQTNRFRVVNAREGDEYTLRFLLRPRPGKSPKRDVATEYLHKEVNAFKAGLADPTTQE